MKKGLVIPFTVILAGLQVLGKIAQFPVASQGNSTGYFISIF